jgi:multidrug resistance efflux pump
LIARRVECRLVAILASDNATGNFIKIVQCAPARITAVSQDLAVGTARAKPAAPGSVIGW